MFAIAAWKVGGVAALIIAIFLAGYHWGALGPRAALEAYKAKAAADSAAQMAKVVAAMHAQASAAATELARRQGVIDEYDKERASLPPTVGMGDRVLKYAALTGARCPTVPKTAADPIGTTDAAASAASLARFNQLFDALGRAVESDAARCRALIALESK
jgi:hypothetical protein